MAHSVTAAAGVRCALAARVGVVTWGGSLARSSRKCPALNATVPTLTTRMIKRHMRHHRTTTAAAAAATAGGGGGGGGGEDITTPSPPPSPRLGFIGAGAMAEAMARGFVEGGAVSFDHICASNSGNEARAALWRTMGAHVCASNAEAGEHVHSPHGGFTCRLNSTLLHPSLTTNSVLVHNQYATVV